MRYDSARFRVVLEQLAGDFAAAPTPFQREWTLRRALRELADDLDHLDRVVRRFVPGEERAEIADDWRTSAADYDDAALLIQSQQVMQAWERPLMERLARAVAGAGGDVLEVGFGMGISADLIQAEGVRSHTIIECNDAVIERFRAWRETYPDRDVRLVRGMWQDVRDELRRYDGILFDTYPLSQEEYLRNEVRGTAYTHAGEFFPLAAELLREGGVFTYFSCEIDTLSRGHQRLLLEHFDTFAVSRVEGLEPPAGCQYWWADSMVVVEARRSPHRSQESLAEVGKRMR